MKRLNYYLLGLGILLAVSCTKTETQSKKGIPVVDVTKTYPKKEIKLQDIADVDYIPLETRDDVLIDNHYQVCTISPDSLLVGNSREGTIFLFNGEGKLLKKFKNKGQSGMEYKEIWGLYYDKPNQEILVLDYIMNYKLQVYDRDGKHKRTILIPKKYLLTGKDIINYDENSLLAYKYGEFAGMSFSFGGDGGVFNNAADSLRKELKPYFFISKKDGKVSDLPISIPKRIETTVTITKGNSISITSANINPFVPNRNELILSEASKDTIFMYAKDKILTPIVVRTPEIQKMNKPLSFLQIEKLTSQYIFGKIIKAGTKEKPKFTDYPIMINRANNEIFGVNLVNTDAPEAKLKVKWFLKNNKSLLLEADELAELLEEGKLKGKLKEIAENMREDDNPVWVRVQFKK